MKKRNLSLTKQAIEEKVLNNKKKEGNLIDEYGSYLSGLIYSSYALGVIGFAADSAIIYSIVYKACASHSASLLISLSLSALIQWFIGSSLTKAVVNFQKRQYVDKGYRMMLIFTLIIAVSALGCSLFLSYQTDQLVEVAARPGYEEKLKEESPIRAEYNERRRLVAEQYQSDRSALLAEVRNMRNDKIMHEGRMVTRYSHLKPIGIITSKKIPKLQEDYNTSMLRIDKEEAAALATVREVNLDNKEAFTGFVNIGGKVTRYANIGFNLLRALLVICIGVFYVFAEDDVEDVSRPTGSDGSGRKKKKEKRSKSRSIRSEADMTNKRSVPSLKPSTVWNGLKAVRTCQNCETDISAKRKDAKFCSSDCRKHYWTKSATA